MTQIKPLSTSPWSSATVMRAELGKVVYPDLSGMEVMLIAPNDHYRKKLFGLGPAYVARAMLNCSIKVSILSCEIFSYDDIEIAKILIQSKIKIFGIGAQYPMFKEVLRVCNIIRAVIPNATIILGGALPSPIPEFALRQTNADIAVIGEAELTIPKLMAAIAGQGPLEAVKGIAFIKDGQFFETGKPELPRMVTRNEVGWPALDLFPIEHYLQAPKFHPFNQNDRIFVVSSGRGCPYACDFCYRVSAYRIRPYDDILDEMEYLIDRYKLNGFYFIDDLLMLSPAKIKGICEGILNRKMKIKFNMTGRVNVVTPEIVDLLKEAGCISIFYGLESGNQKILQTMSKKTTLEQIHDAVQLTKSRGIYVDYGIMFGQPGETGETLADSVKLIKDISYGEYRAAKIFGCIPFPGSGLYDWCKEKGLIKDDADFYNKYICQDWSLDQIPINMTDLSYDEAKRLFREANADLSQFFMEKMSTDWVKAFGGDVYELQSSKGQDVDLSHLTTRVEAAMNTHDLSGRSGT